LISQSRGLGDVYKRQPRLFGSFVAYGLSKLRAAAHI
jgi:hypothetical protein